MLLANNIFAEHKYSHYSKINLQTKSIKELEKLKQETLTQLNTLSKFTFHSRPTHVGYKTNKHKNNHKTVSLKMNFPKTQDITEIILVPVLFENQDLGIIAEGAPIKFNIIAGSNNINGAKEKIIHQFEADDNVYPRKAPIILKVNESNVDWLQFDFTGFSKRSFDDYYILYLSEILVYNKNDNCALQANINSSKHPGRKRFGWNKDFLNDGSLPYHMNTSRGERSIGYVAIQSNEKNSYITFDFKEKQKFNKIIFHSIGNQIAMPKFYEQDFASPHQFSIEIDSSLDFNNPKNIYEFTNEGNIHVPSIVTAQFDSVETQFLRINFDNALTHPPHEEENRIAFAEIEIYNKGDNIAPQAIVSSNLKPKSKIRGIDKLTDKVNNLGEIISIKSWLNELALRHELEAFLPKINHQLDLKHAKQKTILQVLGALLVLLIIFIPYIFILKRSQLQRTIARVKHRLSADLHDELGANLHALRLLMGVAAKTNVPSDKRKEVLNKVDNLLMSSIDSCKNLTKMLEYNDFNLEEAFQKITERLLSDHQHQLNINLGNIKNQLSHQKKMDLFLLYKESLTNIVRHSKATKVDIELKHDQTHLSLIVTDNGLGYTDQTNTVPHSLERRAKLLKGEITKLDLAESGFSFQFKLPLRKRFLGM